MCVSGFATHKNMIRYNSPQLLCEERRDDDEEELSHLVIKQSAIKTFIEL